MTVAEILSNLKPSPAVYLQAARNLAAIEGAGLRPFRLAVLATSTVEFLQPYLVVEGAGRGLKIDPWFAPWGQLEEQALNPAAEIYARSPQAILLLIRIEEWAPTLAEQFSELSAAARTDALEALLSRLSVLLKALRRLIAAPILVANFAPPARLAAGLADGAMAESQAAFMARINSAWSVRCGEVADVFVFDLARLAVEHGLRSWVEPKLFYLARIAFSVSAQMAIAQRLVASLRALLTPRAKVLVLDLDNTLWGGVLGEDGLGGIALGDEYPGNVYKAFQRYLRTLRARGVLLAIASKNNEADAEEVFRHHGECLLKSEDFAAKRINWQEKSRNLAELARELNVGVDALVFFDDSPFEREEVRQNLPAVTVIEVPSSPLSYIDAIEASGAFDSLTLSSEDRQRAELYQRDAARTKAQQEAPSLTEFLRSLDLVATIGCFNSDTLPRIAQLLAKTNQFNLTGRRHSAAEISTLLDAGAIGLWLRLADRFGDHGLVGVAMAVPTTEGWRVDTFLLSCRVIGRAVETALLAALVARCGNQGVLYGEFVPTAKNALVAEFFPAHGFQPVAGGWQFDLAAQQLVAPDFIRLCNA